MFFTFNVESIELVYVEEVGEDYWETLKREKQVKRLSRAEKLKLIECY